MFSRKFFPILCESLRINSDQVISRNFLISRNFSQKTGQFIITVFVAQLSRRPVEEGFSVRHVCSCICKNRFSSFYVICVSQGVRTGQSFSFRLILKLVGYHKNNSKEFFLFQNLI